MKPILLWLCFCGLAATCLAETQYGGWGADARLLTLSDTEKELTLLKQLDDNNIRLIRETIQNEDHLIRVLPALRRMQQHHIRPVCVFPWMDVSPAAPVTGRLQPNLLQVYAKARRWGQATGSLLPAWELANEPDIAFVRAMPDQYVAWSKAAYLGFKSIKTDTAGLPFSPTVLMGSQSLPPGPWLQRAAANGLLHYTDAYNQHFYGHPENFSGLIESIRQQLDRFNQLGQLSQPELPIWITECGLRISPDTHQLENQELRSRQSKYFEEMAQAAIDSGVDVFMPYSLFAHPAFSLLAPENHTPLPAWKAYTHKTKSNLLRAKPHPAKSTSPIICQWRPTPRRSLPHKVSGSYRFRNDSLNGQKSMSGDLLIYNLSEQSIHGEFSWDNMPHVRLTLKTTDSNIRYDQDNCKFTLNLPPMAAATIPVLFFTYEPGYFNDVFSARFTPGTSSTDKASHPDSPLYFSLEARPESSDFRKTTIEGQAPFKPLARLLHVLPFFDTWDINDFSFQYIDLQKNLRFGSVHGPWLGINGVQVSGPWLTPLSPQSKPGHYSLDPMWLFTPHTPSHLKQFPMAITRVDGLPSEGFLFLQADRNMTPDKVQARVDLIDVHHRRFTISENFGKPYYTKSSSVLLNIKDFHPYFWGKQSPQPLNPAEVREIQLRFYYSDPDIPAGFRLYWITPHSYNKTE